MGDLRYEQRHVSRDDMQYDASGHEGPTRHSRFSWWQMAVTEARESTRDECRDDASSSYSTASGRSSTAIETSMSVPLKLLAPRPTLKAIFTHMRAGSTDSDHLESPIRPINIDDWPTPPTSAISATPKTGFSYSQLPWKTHASSIACMTPTSRVGPSPPLPKTPTQYTQTTKPDIPEKSLAGKSTNSSLDQADDHLLQYQLDQLRSEVRTLQHKSSFLEETLKQTVHHRIAVHAERESINPSISLLAPDPLSSDARVIERGRPVSRSGYISPESTAFWQARAPSGLVVVPESSNPPRPRSPIDQTVDSAVEIKPTPQPSFPAAQKKPTLSIMPKLVSVGKTRPPAPPAARPSTAPHPPGVEELRRGSLPRVLNPTSPSERPTSATRAMSEAKALQTAHKLHSELAGGKDSRFDRFVDMWRSIGKTG